MTPEEERWYWVGYITALKRVIATYEEVPTLTKNDMIGLLKNRIKKLEEEEKRGEK
jgi:hypothetical protein